jgi:hypothetical protein
MQKKIADAFWKKRLARTEQIKFKPKLLPVIRKILKLIGLGKSLKRRKIVKSLQGILKFKKKPVGRLSHRRRI